MCGCNPNVKFIEQASSPVYEVPKPTRKLTTSCDTVGKCGIVEQNTFKTSEGMVIAFVRQTGALTSNFPKVAFHISGSGAVTAIGLRQLAEEFAMMADELDGQKTTVAMSMPATQAVKPVKRKYTKRSKAKKKAAKFKAKRFVA